MAATVTVESVLVLGTSVLLYASSLEGGFVFDDHRGILSNDDLNPAKTKLQDLFYHDFWGGHMNREQSHKSYRPFTVMTYRYLNYAIHELEPYGYHVVNVLCHALASLLFLWLCRACFREEQGRWALFAAMLFALHSVHTEVVSGTNSAHTAALVLRNATTSSLTQSGRVHVMWLLGQVWYLFLCESNVLSHAWWQHAAS